MRGVQRRAVLRIAPDHVSAQDDEGHDRRDLDRREPVFDGAERLDAHRVDEDQRRREHANPLPAGHPREPVLHVLGDGRHFGAYRQHDAGPAPKDPDVECATVISAKQPISSSVISPPMA
ncbi:hypothetical protein G6F57_022224 [Rhizopus arrhizus]|nr:hypothetical protein G6F57_022224 [Rhizopus arrhizus]